MLAALIKRKSQDIAALVRKYAELVYTAIPFENADGTSINLKVPGKSPRVIVNTDNPVSRQRFTLAHELGHLLIPWHVGTIIDNLDLNLSNSSSGYWKIEEEANQFAAALLMPLRWVKAVISAERNLAKVHHTISDECETSDSRRLCGSRKYYTSILSMLQRRMGQWSFW